MSALDAMTVDQVATWVRSAGQVLIRKDAERAAVVLDCLVADATAAVGAKTMDQRVAEAHENRDKIAEVLARVALRHCVTVAAIKGPRRLDHLVSARSHAAWTLRHRLRMSYPAIGLELGKRHHTTAMDLVQSWEKHLAERAKGEDRNG